MSSEIHKLFREQFPTVHRLQETSLGDIHNLKYVEWLEMSFQSERLSHEETKAQSQNAIRSSILWQKNYEDIKAQLEALEDAIRLNSYECSNGNLYYTFENISKSDSDFPEYHKPIRQAIQNSRARKQNDA